MSIEAAEFTRAFTTSVVLGDDIIPRLGIQPMLTLRERLLRALASCRRHKWRLICGCLGAPTRDVHVEDAETAAVLQAFHAARQQMRQACADALDATADLEGSAAAGRARCATLSAAAWLWPPGDVFYLQPQGKGQFTACWADRRSFGRIVVSGRMFADHLPDAIAHALVSLSSLSNEEADDTTPLLP